MDTLLPIAAEIAALLRQRDETVAVAESSAAGLVSAALLAQPGASAYFLGGVVVYTRDAREKLLGVTAADMSGLRPSTESYALLLAARARECLGTSWAIGETGAAGPTGNRYGDAAGHACIGVSGKVRRAVTVETRHDDRAANMQAFALAALTTLRDALLEAG